MTEKISSLSNTFFLLWVQSLGLTLTLTYRHTDYEGSEEGRVQTAHGTHRREAPLTKLQ